MDADTTAVSKLESTYEPPILETHNVSTSVVLQTYPPSTNYVGLADLPTELYLDIFESLCPTFRLIYPGNASGAFWEIADQITSHRQAVRRYADLRLICSRLTDVLTPIIYREMVVCISEATRLDRLASAFECGAAHLHRLVILGDEQDHLQSSYGDAPQVIGHGLSLCSQLKSIECYGNHLTFTKRGWLARTAPNLISTVTSLVFLPNPNSTGVDLSHSLVGLRAHLRSLEIHYWERRLDGFPFHLPSEIPHLTHLLLRGGYPSVEDVKKLITRATQKKTPKSSALRSFSMIDVRSINEIDIMAILSINNLCSQLTVLHCRLRYPSDNFRDVVISVVKACPNLVDFSYGRSFHKDIFHHLPPALEHLELSLYLSVASGDDLDAFAEYLRSGRCQALRTLTVVREHTYVSVAVPREFDEAFLAFACDDIGVSFAFM
jgi:hypothetical protein